MEDLSVNGKFPPSNDGQTPVPKVDLTSMTDAYYDVWHRKDHTIGFGLMGKSLVRTMQTVSTYGKQTKHVEIRGWVHR